MGSDTPGYTPRELAQRLLIDRIDEILKQTGRSTGFPGEAVYANKTAKWGEDGGVMARTNQSGDQVIAGPPAVAITRVVQDNRDSDGLLEDLFGTGLNTYDSQTLVNAFVPKQTLSLLDLDSKILNSLVPQVTVYKLYPAGGLMIPVEFKKSWLKPNPLSAKAFSGGGQPQHKDIRVGFTGCTITQMGENPALVDSNLKVQLTVETQDLNNLFYRWKIPRTNDKCDPTTKLHTWAAQQKRKVEAGTLDPAKLARSEGQRILDNGIAWIDLIKMNPKGTANSNSCDLSYNPAESAIKLVINYGTPSPSSIRRMLRDARPALIYRTAAAARAAIDKSSNRRLTETAKAKIIADAEYNERLIGEEGEEEFNKRIEQLTPTYDKIKEIIQNHKQIYYLQLSHHEFVLGPDLQVELKIHYIARSELMTRTPQADLLNDPKVRQELADVTQKMKSIEAQLAPLQEVVPEEGLDPDSKAYAEIVAGNADRESCRGPLKAELKTIQTKYDAMLRNSKKRLYNQLVLKDHPSSRIYKVRIPKGLPLQPEFRLNPHQESIDYPLLIRNYTDAWWNPGQNRSVHASIAQPELDKLANGEEMNDDVSGASDERTNLLIKSFSDEQDYYQLNFVFIGDIVEAALELVAYNNEYFGKTPIPRPGEQAGIASISGGAVSTFYREVNEDGTLGPLATATIDLLGKYVFGDIELPRKLGAPGIKCVNIADIPIDVEFFRTFWFNKVISKPGRTTYFLKNLIDGIMSDLIPYAITSRAVTAHNTDPKKPPTTKRNYFSLPGTGQGLNAKLRKEIVPPKEPKKATKDELKAWVDLQTGLNDKERAQLQEMCEEDPTFCAAAATQEVHAEVKYVPYFTTSEISEQLEKEYDDSVATLAAAGGCGTSPPPPTSYDVVLIQQKPAGAVRRTGSPEIDKTQSIQHYILNVANKKALISATFKRNDVSAMQTANLMQDSVINSRGIMREKYDADVLLRGNVVYKPGAILYIDHSRLQSNKIDVDSFNRHYKNNMLDWALKVSPARALGLGGYFTVISVSHDFGHLGTGAKWLTTLSTKWLSFEHIKGLADPCGEAPTSSENVCLIEATKSRIEQAEIAAKKAEEAAEKAAAEAKLTSQTPNIPMGGRKL